MKTVKIFAVAVAMIAALSSCNKDGGAEQPNGQNFNVTLEFSDPAATRADQAAVTGTPIVAIDNGYICFVATDNSITQVYKIVSGSPAAGEIANGTGAKVFTDVPAVSTKVYLIANVGAVAAPVVDNKINTYLSATSMDVKGQGDVRKVVVIGNSTLVGTATDKTATITPTTNVTRVQIKEIELGAGFTAGTVEGIYVNGFYKSLKLDGTGGTLLRSTTNADFIGTSAIYTGYSGIVYDESGFSASFVTSIVPTSGVWGYNLFATGTTPQIIVKLKDVNVGSGILAKMFATVGTFKKGAVDITEFEAGKYYTIDKITIPTGGIATEPGVTTVNATVTVNSVTWAEENITGEI